jgi:hypothetical protein
MLFISITASITLSQQSFPEISLCISLVGPRRGNSKSLTPLSIQFFIKSFDNPVPFVIKIDIIPRLSINWSISKKSGLRVGSPPVMATVLQSVSSLSFFITFFHSSW